MWGLQRRGDCERLLLYMGVHSFISTTQKERELLHLLRGSLPRRLPFPLGVSTFLTLVTTG